MVVSGETVDTQAVTQGIRATLDQVVPLFIEQTSPLSTYQLNFIRAICQGHHDDFGKAEVTSKFNLGTRSNLPKLKNALIEREIIEVTETGLYIADPLFKLWFSSEMM